MNKKINELTAELEQESSLSKTRIEAIQKQLDAEYSKVFAKDKDIEKALANLEQASMYGFDRYGEIIRWFRFNGLEDIPENARNAFEAYALDYCAYVNWEDSTLYTFEGDSLVIQSDTRHDNGVWINGKCVIDEAEYKNEDGEIDEDKRNALIEAYMEKTGYFPGVFRVDYHGNIFPVNTCKAVQS